MWLVLNQKGDVMPKIGERFASVRHPWAVPPVRKMKTGITKEQYILVNKEFVAHNPGVALDTVMHYDEYFDVVLQILATLTPLALSSNRGDVKREFMNTRKASKGSIACR
jgi:hypothetical protein